MTRKDRAVLGVTKDGPGLAVYDDKAQLHAGLTVGKDGPVLTLLDESGSLLWSAP